MDIDDEFIPNLVFDFRDVLLFLIKTIVVAFNPNGLKCDTFKEVPNVNFLAIFFRNPFPKQNLFPIETIVVTGSHSTKFVHDESSQPLRSMGLDVISKLVHDRFTRVFGNRGWGNFGPPFIDCHRLIPNISHESGIFAGSKRVPHLRPKDLIVTWEVTLSFIRRPSVTRVPIDNGVFTVIGSI